MGRLGAPPLVSTKSYGLAVTTLAATLQKELAAGYTGTLHVPSTPLPPDV